MVVLNRRRDRSRPPHEGGHLRERWSPDAGTVLFTSVALAFLVILLPVIVRGEPLADDYYSCIRHTEVGLSGALHQSLVGTGAVRPARFLEILLLSSLCGRVPFGLLMLVPLALTLSVAFLVRGLLRDLGADQPWPDIAAVIWLLAPLGAESALWPSALHVPLGLAFALGSLRSYRRERHVLGGVLALLAFLSLEQAIFALPLAAFLVTPDRRVRSLLGSGSIALATLTVFAAWPGESTRTTIGLGARIAGAFQDPVWYAKFPVAGLGLHSIPLAVQWGLPFSVVMLGIGAWLGLRLGRWLSSNAVGPSRWDPGSTLRIGGAATSLALLINIPEIVTVPRGVSGRIFAPTWLLLAGMIAFLADRIGVPRAPWLWACEGVFFAGAVLSLALCVSVRLDTADFTESSSRYIAARLSQPNEVVAVCGVRRTIVSPAPVGSFAITEFTYDWSARYSLEYHTGETATFLLGGPLWGSRCPDLSEADLVVRFADLLDASSLEGERG